MNCPKPDDDNRADDDRPSRAGYMAATPGDRCRSGAAKRAVKTTPDQDLVQIVERLRNSKGGFTEQTNQDCAVLVTRAEQLAGTLHTCRSLSGESYFCGLWSTYSSLAPRLTGSARCSRALSHADYTEEPWFVQGKAQVFFHNPSKRRLRTGSSGAWVTGSKAVIMLLPHRLTGDKQHQRRTARTERRGLQFGGRGVHKDDVLVLHGSDVDSGFKARKYQLLEQRAAAPALSAEQQPERHKKKADCSSEEEQGGSSGAAAEPDPTLHQFETTGASDIRHVTRSEANSMQVIRQALSRFDDRKKIELLHKARNELIAEMGDAPTHLHLDK